MHDGHTSDYVIVVSDSEAIVNFCRAALGNKFSIRCIKDISEISNPMSFAFAAVVIDYRFIDWRKFEKDIRQINLLCGNVLLLVDEPFLKYEDLQRNIPDGTFVPFPCDIDFFTEIVMEKISQRKMPMVLSDSGVGGIQKTLDNANVHGFEKFVGNSKVVVDVKKKLATLARNDIAVLLLGESGTGKSFVAKLVHQNSSRRDKNFKSINMASLHEHLADSTLFGSVKGAYTGAMNRAGLFADANGGTLFMDEIGEMSLELQAKLLTVLDKKKFYRLGSDVEMSADVRIICATNKNLEALVRAGKFRMDLYFRIARMKVVMPPLRSRAGDIKILVNNFLKKIAPAAKKISTDAMRKLEEYSWPGNVRQLENCLEAACILCEGDTIFPEHIVFVDDGLFC